MKLAAVFLFVLGIVLAQGCSPRVTVEPMSTVTVKTTTAAPTETFTEVPPTVTPSLEEITPTSIAEIEGIWDSRVLSERGYHEFRQDGTLIMGFTIEQVRSHPVFSETVKYWFEGDVFHVEDSCGHGTYHLALQRENGQNRKLMFQVIEDPCEQRILDWKVPMRWYGPQ